MKSEKFSKKSGKAIAKTYLNIVKFSKAFRIFVLAFLLLMIFWIFTASVKSTTVIAVCVILLVCNHLVIQNQIRQYNNLPYILHTMLDAEKYLDVCLVLKENIKRTSGMSALNLANAYYWNGEYDKAKAALDSAVVSGNKQATLIMDVQYDMINFNICAAAGDITACEMLIARMEKRLYDNQSKAKLSAVLNEFIIIMKAGYALASKNFEEYIALEASMGEAKSALNYVSRQYNLAGCYTHLGSSNMAANFYENVLSKPGNLYIQKLAKQKLHTLKGEQHESDRS